MAGRAKEKEGVNTWKVSWNRKLYDFETEPKKKHIKVKEQTAYMARRRGSILMCISPEHLDISIFESKKSKEDKH